MADFYAPYPQQQQQQQGQQSSSYYGNANTTTNNSNGSTNQSSSYGQSTSEELQTTAGQEPSWQPSSFAAPSSTAAQQQQQQQHYQYPLSQQPPSSQKQQYQTQQTQQTQQQQQSVNRTYAAPPPPAPTPISNNPISPTNGTPNPSVWNPAFAASVASTAMSMNSGDKNAYVDMGIVQGQKFLDEGIARMIPGLERSMRGLRVYFAVNNSYVKRKMGRVLFPFLNKDWGRRTSDPSDLAGHSYELPHSDDNALDLYIPTMSLITYVLLCALCYGSAGQFDPAVLPDVISSCVLTQIFEVLLFRIGFYTMSAPIALLDLLAITGYKYLGLVVNMAVGVLLEVSLDAGSRRGYFVAFLWTASAAGFFVLKTMTEFVPNVTSSKGPKREFMILGFGASQLATMWFLGQTKFFN